MKKTPWYTFVALSLILAALAYFLYFKPKTKEMEGIRKDRVKLEAEVKDLQVKKQQLDKIQKEIASLTATLKELESIIPLKKDIDNILRQIQQIATDSRLDVINFVPQNPVRREFYAEQSYAIKVTGNYHNLAIFFSRLNAFSRLFSVDKFSIKALQNQKEDLTISSDFIAKTYLFLEEPQDTVQIKPGLKQTPQTKTPVKKAGRG